MHLVLIALDDFNCIFTQIRCLSVLLVIYPKDSRIQLKVGTFAQNKFSSTLLLEMAKSAINQQSANYVSRCVKSYKRKLSMHDMNIFL